MIDVFSAAASLQRPAGSKSRAEDQASDLEVQHRLTFVREMDEDELHNAGEGSRP